MSRGLRGQNWRFGDGVLSFDDRGDYRYNNGELEEDYLVIDSKVIKDAFQQIDEAKFFGGLGSLKKVSFGHGNHIASDMTDGLSVLGDKKVDLEFDFDVISKQAFKGCQNVGRVILHNQIQDRGVPQDCFADSSVYSIYAPKGAAFFDRSFKNCSNLTSLVVTNDNSEYGKWDSDVEARNSAFEGTSLMSVDFPCNTYIESRAFADCKDLGKISFHGSERFDAAIQIGENAFEGSNLSYVDFTKISFNQYCKFNKKWPCGLSHDVTIDTSDGARRVMTKEDIAKIGDLNYEGKKTGKQSGKGEVIPKSVKPIDLPKANKSSSNTITFNIDTLNEMRKGLGKPSIPTAPSNGSSGPDF